MSYPSWPSQLPRPERSSWQSMPQEARLQRQSDAGPPSWRRRFSSWSETKTLSVVLTRSEKGIFDTFYRETVSAGARLFWMPDPTTDGWPLLTDDGQPIYLPDGQPLLAAAQWLCSFGDQLPTETLVGLEFRKTFNVVVMP